MRLSLSLTVAIANDNNEPALVKKIARQLVKDQSILAVVGHNSSDATLAAAPEYEQGKLVMISATSDAKTISGIGTYIFRTIPSVRFQADTLSRYAIQIAKKTNLLVCFDSQTQYSVSLKEEFTSTVFADGGKILPLQCDFSAAGFNANNIVSQGINNGAEGILLIPSVDKISSAIQVARASQKRLLLLASSTAYTIQTLKEGQDAVERTIIAVPWHPQAIANNPFPQQAVKLWGGQVNWRTALAYDATKAIIAGLQTSNKTREGLQQALSNSNFSVTGASGKIQFLPSGDRNSADILVEILPRPSSASQTGYDFVPLNNRNGK